METLWQSTQKTSIRQRLILKNESYFDAVSNPTNRILKIKKGDTYNGIELEKRIADASDPDAFDLTNLYQNNGYLFSTITPVEVSTDGNVIDMEIRRNG